jgi:hypothetical protein
MKNKLPFASQLLHQATPRFVNFASRSQDTECNALSASAKAASASRCITLNSVAV